jgi:para-nitrobenzyl esterase
VIGAEVRTPAGTVRGSVQDGVGRWLGVPFAAPPVGRRRFLPPEPPLPWSGVRDATRFGAISVQDVDPLPMVVPGAEHGFHHPGAVVSEDCLTLNVWAPTGPGPHPVLVWIHGGGNFCGSGSAPWADGSTLAAEHGVVVVTINYRLGLLGWLDLEAYAPGAVNLGLQDQVAALRWVRDAIAGFGGDPDRVTVAGESAGAIATAQLLATPQATGLFHRAVVQSAQPGIAAPRELLAAATAGLLQVLHLEDLARRDPAAVLPALQRVGLLRLQAVQRMLGTGIVPVVDGVWVPADHTAAAAASARRGVEVILGSNAEENKLFDLAAGGGGTLGTPDDLRARLRAILPGDTDGQAVEEVAAHYRALADGDLQRAWDLAATHHDWTAPTHRFARDYAAAGGRVHVYEFGWRSDARDGAVGAAHFLEVPFVLGNLHQPGTGDLLGPAGGTAEARTTSRTLTARWAGFVAHGDPGADWRPFCAADPAVLRIEAGRQACTHDLGPSVDLWHRHTAVAAPGLAALAVR